jgi:GT2 family glycosyltransferase
MNGRVGAVIVTYNSRECVGRSIDSCLRAGLDVVVVDNASNDGTADVVAGRPGVKLIRNRENRGFAAAVNQGFRLLDNEYVLLLNPDAELIAGVMALKQELLEAGAAGGMLIGLDGGPQTGFTVRRFPTATVLALEVLGINRIWRGNAANRWYRCLDLNLNEASEVDQPAGAFLMVRHEAWERIGGFDENFFPVWYEDVDFCLRLKAAGYRIRYTPLAVARHDGGHSVRTISEEASRLYWYGSLLNYVAKHFRPRQRRVICFAVAAGSVLRMAAGILLDRNIHAIVVYARVMRLAVTFFQAP